MNAMVERVAKAIFDCSGYDDAVNFHLEDWSPAARAAIGAMRAPTEAMMDSTAEWRGGDPEAYWTAMIDAALKDKSAPSIPANEPETK